LYLFSSPTSKGITYCIHRRYDTIKIGIVNGD
jgi:hypothetical protein